MIRATARPEQSGPQAITPRCITALTRAGAEIEEPIDAAAAETI